MTVADASNHANSSIPKKKRVRSPAYPAYGLEDCIAKADAIHKIEDEHSAPLEAVAAHWKYKTNNSAFMQYLSALKQFGLLKEDSSKKGRQFKLTERALNLLAYAKDHPKWSLMAKEAALDPKIHAELWAKYGGKLPRDDVSIRLYLTREREDGRFNKDHVDGFISQFRETLRFANVAESDTVNKNGGDELPVRPNVGDFVQWTSQGVDRFDPPRRVLGFNEQDGEKFAFVEGSETGIPMSELTAVNLEKPAGDKKKSPPVNPYFQPAEDEGPPEGTARERTDLDEGPVVLSMPKNLSEDSVKDFEYWTKGILRKMRRKAGMKPSDKDDD